MPDQSAISAVVLASSSPRRRELLAQLGVEPVVAPADIDESTRVHESPSDYVLRLARGKALKVAAVHAGALVIGADTTIADGDCILGKPANCEHAKQMLSSLSGREHLVHTGVAVARDDAVESVVVTTQVKFFTLNDQEIQDYVDTGESDGKAGAYAIQGLGAILVERINGSYSNVVGLPLAETAGLMKRLGFSVLSRQLARRTGS